jgi:hydroxyacylglutathione hydrolase
MAQIIQIDLNTENCYLIKNDDKFILIDTGGYTFNDKIISGKQELFEKKLLENGCIPGNLNLVILTHGDIDHIGNCKFLEEKYHPHMVIHKDDYELTKNLSVDKIFSNFKFNSLLFKIATRMMHTAFEKKANIIIEKYEEFNIDESVDENSNFEKYGLTAEIIHLPGHTKGSIGILLEDGSFFCGDVFSNIGRPSTSINALSFSDLNKSIGKLPADKIKMVYPGHGKPFEFSQFVKI